MKLNSLRIRGYRSYRDETISFQPGHTVLFGENNTGKSTISTALEFLISRLMGRDPFNQQRDRPYGTDGEVYIEATVSLDLMDRAAIELALIPGTHREDNFPHKASKWITEADGVIRLICTAGTQNPYAVIVWQGLAFEESRITAWHPSATNRPNRDIGHPSFETILELEEGAIEKDWIITPNFRLPSLVGDRLTHQLRITSEFRMRAAESRSNAVESLTGAETASVLLNLKNHSAQYQRKRYELIRDTFHSLFPRFDIEAVERSPGSAEPTIQFSEGDTGKVLSIAQVSAGVHQVLTTVTNLIGQSNLILFIEHPEQHLHPHAMRYINRLIRTCSQDNQIIVCTHDPHFVSPEDTSGFRRVWWTQDYGSRIYGVSDNLSGTERAQIGTVLRLLGNREMLFARCVILVEDETQAEIVRAVAETLGYDLDAHSTSVIPVGGEDGYAPYDILVRTLRIPVVRLRDKLWRDSKRYPPEDNFSFGREVEDYLDDQGLAALRLAAKAEVGTSKRRIGGSLAKHLASNEVPEVFRRLLDAAIARATGEPANSEG